MTVLDSTKRSEIVSRINRLSPNADGLWGQMNANQMICHCTDQLRVSLGEMGMPEKPPGLFARTVLKFLVLYLISIPKNVPTSPKVDQLKDGTKPTDFESDRRTLIEYIEKFVAAPQESASTPHFKFGNMNKSQWSILATKHLDHHLKQFGV